MKFIENFGQAPGNGVKNRLNKIIINQTAPKINIGAVADPNIFIIAG
ncbi:MAG: hypothetical protein LBS60_03590 [Deltaproteobacteria bacterium]|nr:hypothetical protein [Deltaproteobacteria bacterium]